MTIQFLRRLTLFVLCVFLLQLTSTGVASAHASIVRSDPADGSTLPVPPEKITLWFDEAVSIQFSSIRLLDTNNQPISGIKIESNPDDPTSLIIIPPRLPDGVYSLLWRVLSENDGHYAQGILVIGVGENADLSTANASLSNDQPPWQEVVLRWLNFLSLILLAGTLSLLVFVLPVQTLSRENPDLAFTQRLRERVWSVARWSAGLGLVAGMGLLAWQIAALKSSLADEVSLLQATQSVLITTAWGKLWLARESALLLVFLALELQARRLRQSAPSRQITQAGWWIMAATVAAIVAQSLSSHAPTVADDPIRAVIVDVLHLVAAGLWMGSLLTLALVSWYALKRDPGLKDLLRGTWRRFSVLAALGLGLLVATGLYSMGQEVASLDALLTTFYGRALSLKIVGVVVAAGMGALNSALLHPSLVRPFARWLGKSPGWTPVSGQKLPRLIAAEAVVGALILLATAVATASAPPRGIEHTIAAEEIPTSLSQRVDDLLITLQIKPNRPGQNVYNVFAASNMRPEPAKILRVILRFHYVPEDLGLIQADAEPIASDQYPLLEELREGRYMVTGSYLSLAGHWQIDVVIRRQGVEDSVAHFDWTVAPPGDVRPVLVSKQPWKPYLSLLSALALLFVPVLVYGMSRTQTAGDIAETGRAAHPVNPVPSEAPTSDHASAQPNGPQAPPLASDAKHRTSSTS